MTRTPGTWVYDHAAAWLNGRLRLGPQPRWPLDCGCLDDGPRFVYDCGRTTCERHRSDPHDHAKETADA